MPRIMPTVISSVKDAETLIRSLGADAYAVRHMARKALLRPLLARGVDNRAANILKQELLACGADAAVSRKVAGFARGTSDMALLATPAQYDRLVRKLAGQPFGLSGMAQDIVTALKATGVRRLQVMGILNVTPDSFFDGGRYAGAAAVSRALAMLAEGAAIIDVGGESSRPGARPVPEDEELRRVLPVIRALRARTRKTISIDTYKPAVARAALDAGADMVNDITGLRYGRGAMAAVVARARVPVVVMHMRGTPRTMQKSPRYHDVVADIRAFFDERLRFAEHSGIPRERVILDPGIGFGKTPAHTIALLRNLPAFSDTGCRLLIGASRKSFIGALTGTSAAADRLGGSIAAAVWACQAGADVLRVHDVKQTIDAITVTGALNAWK